MKSLLYVLAFAVFISVTGAQIIGTAQIRAPAVVLGNETGVLTPIKLTVTNGNGNVIVTGPQIIGVSTTQSAETAAQYASRYLNRDFYNYNFNYSIENGESNVSGASAGAAMTLLAISALSGTPLLNNFTMTGTVSSDGAVGVIGGVYDKTGAAEVSGMRFMLVPAVSHSSAEERLYVLTQDAFGVPLVQVANISNAWRYATTLLPIVGASYNFYTDYKVDMLPNAQLVCSNACSQQSFGKLANFTVGLTKGAIENLSGERGFYNTSAQLGKQLDESNAIIGKGYLYMGSNFAFLTYLDTFYLLNHASNLTNGLSTLNAVQGYCSTIIPSQLTNLNYEFVLGGELRQTWASYTLNATISAYNLTSADTDEILSNLYSAGSANAWCRAANFMYQSAADIGGTPVTQSQALKNMAATKINQTSQYSGMYLSGAELAYNEGNYALAMLNAAYAYSLGAQMPANSSTLTLISDASQLASNSTYGIWATQFANEALFYSYEAQITANSTDARAYAVNAYQTAVLASQISNATRLIYSNLVSAPANTTTIPAITTTIPQSSEAMLQVSISMLTLILLVIVVVLIATVLGLVLVIIHILNRRGKPVRRTRRRRSR